MVWNRIQKLRHFFGVTLTLAALGVAERAYAADPLSLLADRLAQLAQWELLSNPGILPADIDRLANSIRGRLTRNGNISARTAALSSREIVARPFYPDCYEIPIEALRQFEQSVLAEGWDQLPAGARELLTFERAGRRYVRWLVHPTNPTSNRQGIHRIVDVLRQRGFAIPPARRARFQAYLSASRSLLLPTPDGEAISVKVSMPAAAGAFRDKEIHFRELEKWQSHQTLFHDIVSRRSPEPLPILPEPVAIGGRLDIETYLEDGFLVRNLHLSQNHGPYLLPSFALFDPAVHASLLQPNHAENSRELIEEHLVEPLARSQARIRAYAGAEHSSPHSQNILLRMSPEGQIYDRAVIRDLDFYLEPEALEAWDQLRELPPVQEARLVLQQLPPIQFSLFNGIPIQNLPEFATPENVELWANAYFSTYANDYRTITGNALRLGTRQRGRLQESNGNAGTFYDLRDRSLPNVIQSTMDPQNTSAARARARWFRSLADCSGGGFLNRVIRLIPARFLPRLRR